MHKTLHLKIKEKIISQTPSPVGAQPPVTRPLLFSVNSQSLTLVVVVVAVVVVVDDDDDDYDTTAIFTLCAFSEDHSGGQGILHPRRHTALRQVPDTEELHEGLCSGPELFLSRLQPVVT